MFWKSSTSSSNHIDALLNKPDVTLEELMDEEEILQECRSQNKRFFDFLCRPENIEQLVTYITVEPPADLDEKIRYRYPNLACELLTCDIPSLNDNLSADGPLSKLFAFLENEPPLNPLLASFVSRTLGILVSRKSDQNWYLYSLSCLRVMHFLQSKGNCISLILNHLGTSAIMDLMLKVMTQIEGNDIRQNLLDWLESQKAIPSLIGLFKPEVDADRHSNASQLISDVIRKSRENIMLGTDSGHKSRWGSPDPILSALENTETISELIDNMLSGERQSESGIVGGIGVLLTLLEQPNFQKPIDEDLPQIFGAANATSAIMPRLEDFHKLLLNPPQKPPVKTTVGTLDPPLGNTRLQVARLIAALIGVNHPPLNEKLASLGTMEVLLDLFFKYQWNNFLHTQVEQCIAAALGNQSEASGNGDPQMDCLVENLLIKCDLLRRILDAWEENETNQLQQKSQRRGYMGHLIKIANNVEDQVSKCSLKPVLEKQLSPEVLALWENFVKNQLSEINKTHNIFLGGGPPIQTLQLDKEEVDYEQIAFPTDTPQNQAFTDYQLQSMAPLFNEDYRFHDNEFNDAEDTLQWQMSERRENSSSDEDEDDDDEENEMRRPTKSDVRMDVDGNDIWSSGAATLDTIADFENPWNSGTPDQPSNAFGSTDAGWADFSSFETNFSSSTQLNDSHKPSGDSAFGESSSTIAHTEPLDQKEPEKTPESETVISEPLPSTSQTNSKDMQESESSRSDSTPEVSGVSFVESDANANPTTHADDVTSTASAMVDEVATAAVAAVRVVVADKLGLDNQRYLAVSQDENATSPQNDSADDRVQPVAPEDPQDKRDVESSVADDISSKAA